MRRRTSKASAAFKLLRLLLLVAAVAAARSARVLHQAGTAACPDLVAGAAWEGSVAAAAGAAAAPVAAFEGVGSIYAVAAAEDASSPAGPSQYSLEIWNDAASTQAAGAAAGSSGCATMPVVDFCQQAGGPATVQVRLVCTNGDGRTCSVRLAVYMSACPGRPQPAAVALDSSSGSSSSGSQTAGGTGAADASGAPPGSEAPAASPKSSAGGSSSISTWTWVVIGVGVGAALLAALLLWLCCCRWRRRQPGADLESGGHAHPGKQQQFVVSGGSQQQQPSWKPSQQQQQQPQPWQQLHAAAAQPLPPGHAAPAAATGVHAGEPVAQAWAFAYKVPAQRLTFATDASRRTAQPQRWERVDDWLAAACLNGGPGARWEGCLLYNDDPPELFPDGSPTGYPGPLAYKPCGHAKGVLLWGPSAVGWLVHSLPRWPCHDRSSPSGLGRRLSEVQDSQTDKGQSFMFVQLPRTALPAVLQQLRQMQVLVYFTSDPSIWPHAPGDYAKATGRGFSRVQLGPGLWHLAKANEPTANFYQALSEGWGGQRWWLRTNLVVKDKARNVVPSSGLLLNIATLQVPGFDHRPYLAGSEHAKVAVCVGRRDGDQPNLLMVGDLNNTYPQWRRGGGGLVLHSPALWQLLRLMAVDVGEP